MTFEAVVFVALVSGLIGALIGVFANFALDTRRAERERVISAMREFYGPMVQLLSECQLLSEIRERLMKVYPDHFNQPWHDSAMELVRSEADATLKTANRYTELTFERLGEIAKLAGSHRHLIDTDDLALVRTMGEHYTRLCVEYETDHGKRMAAEIKMTLGSPVFFDSRWLAHFEGAFGRKQQRLRQLIWPIQHARVLEGLR